MSSSASSGTQRRLIRVDIRPAMVKEYVLQDGTREKGRKETEEMSLADFACAYDRWTTITTTTTTTLDGRLFEVLLQA